MTRRSGVARGSSWRKPCRTDETGGRGGSGWGSETGERKAASQHNLNVTPFKQTLLTKAPEFHPPRHFLDKLK